MRIVHPWAPVFDGGSRVLILGTMPSPKSREYGCYYGNPQNCFWETLARALNKNEPPHDRASREKFLLDNQIALWDVLHECEIDGAADGSIKNPTVNNFADLLAKTHIQMIFTTGKTATQLFNKHCADEAGMRAVYLPSTSPANRAMRVKPAFSALWGRVAEALRE